jgi:hypothetical protein
LSSIGGLYTVAATMDPVPARPRDRRQHVALTLAVLTLAIAAGCTRAAQARFEGTRPPEVLVEVLPSAAEVALDGRPLGTGGRAVPVPPRDRDAHVVEARAAGFELEELSVEPGLLAGTRIGIALRPEGYAGPLDFDDAAGLTGAAAFLLSASRPEEAREYARRAVALEPRFAASHRILGDAEALRGDARAAAASWAEYLRLAPEAPDAAAVAEAIDDAAGGAPPPGER